MTDLANLDTKAASNEGRPMVLLHPTTGADLSDEKGNLFTINLLGKESEKVNEVYSQIYSQYRGSKEPTYGKAKQQGRELLAACTTGWDNLIFEGKPLVFTHKNAIKLYKDYQWIYEQVDEFTGDRANFLDSSEPDLPST